MHYTQTKTYRISFVLFLLSMSMWTISCAPSNTPDNLESFDATPAGRLYEFELKDGTQCVYLARGSQGGLSCNWSQN